MIITRKKYDERIKEAWKGGRKAGLEEALGFKTRELAAQDKGFAIISKEAYEKNLADAKKDGAYEVSQKFKGCAQQYKKIIKCNVDECWLPEDIPMGKGYADSYRIFEQVFKDMV